MNETSVLINLSEHTHERRTHETFACVRSHLKKHLENHPIEDWLTAHAPSSLEPFYSSIDIRDAGYKLAPVDANLFPAGFNNICIEDLRTSPEIARPVLTRHFSQWQAPGAFPRLPKTLAIIPESHTKNRFYADNLRALREIFRRSGVEAEIGWFDENSTEKTYELETSTGEKLTVYLMKRHGDKIRFEPFEPEFILLNNDYSSGIPSFLHGVTQPIEPSYKMGWHTRKKSDFFNHYNRLAFDLATTAKLDPWHLQVDTRLVSEIDFSKEEGMDRIAKACDEVLEKMRYEYAKRGITETPFVFVKNNAGTYGMGILRVEKGSDLLELNRREKNKMAVGKNHLQVHEVIVQEGIPTRYFVDGVYAEPVIYLLGNQLLGGFLRKNPTRGKIDNLNSKGMVFQKLCISDLRNEANRDLELEMVYGTIASLSCAAIGLEIASIEKAASN